VPKVPKMALTYEGTLWGPQGDVDRFGIMAENEFDSI